MSFIKELYSESRVDMIYELLKKEAELGNAKDYDISIDGLKVVSRNKDPERFWEFEQYIVQKSKNITISVHERSHRCIRYILLLQKEELSVSELSGIENGIEVRIRHERAKWENKRLEEDYDSIAQKLKECEEYTQGLEQKISELELEKNSGSGQLTNTIAGLASAYFSKNPEALNGIPIIGALLGGKKQQPALDGSRHECLCSTAPQTYTGELTIGDEQRLKMALVPYFRGEYREKVMKALLYFFRYNHFIDQTVNGIETLLEKNEKSSKEKG